MNRRSKSKIICVILGIHLIIWIDRTDRIEKKNPKMSARNSISFTFGLLLALAGWFYQKNLNPDVFNKLLLNCIFSFVVFLFLMYAIPISIPLFLKAKHGGHDMGKADRRFL